MSAADKEMDERCFARVATFEGYCDFIGALADYYVNVKQVTAFKFTECYYRSLNYANVEKSTAKACFKQERHPDES